MGPEINAQDWALVLATCEASDQKSMLEGFSERLQFSVRELMGKVDHAKIDQHKLRNIRKAIIQSYMRNSNVNDLKVATDDVEIKQAA